MRIDVESKNGVLVVRVEGELDAATAPVFREAVESALDKTMARDLILNLKGVGFIDSSGLGAILGRYRRVSQAGGRVCLGSVPSKTRRILDLSGIPRIIPIFESEAEALASFGAGTE